MTSDKVTTRRKLILDCAIKLLRDRGDAGLTMRQIAESAQMSLSNVQYYFRTRDDVLLALVQRYFAECTEELLELAQSYEDHTLMERLEGLLTELLKHGTHLSDMCRIFRELWAISSRNELIEAEISCYYEGLASVLAESILGANASPDDSAFVSSLLLPFVEGYSLTATALPMKTDAVVRMLTELTLDGVSDHSL